MKDRWANTKFSRMERPPFSLRKTLTYLVVIIPLIIGLTACKERSYPSVHRFIDHYSITKKLLKYEEQISAIKAFEFNTDGNDEGWKPVYDIGSFVVKDGKLHITAIDDDPYMITDVDFDADQVTAISITLKVSKGDYGKIFWTTENDPEFSEDLSEEFVLVPDNKFHTHYIFTEDLAKWKGRITQFRLDPTDSEGEIEIDEIKLLNLPIAERYQVEPAEKRWRVLYKAAINNESRNIILAIPPSEIEQTVDVPREAIFDFGYGILRNVWGSPGDGVQFSVRLTDPEGEAHTLFSHYIDPKKLTQHRRWFDARVDLSPWGEKEVKLALQTEGSFPIEPPFSRKPDIRYDYAVWSDPTVYSPKIEQKEPNVILIMLDTLRADALGCYGYRRPTSPNIDRLAEDSHSVIFNRAFSSAPWTLPSHTNMFTSKHLAMNLYYEPGRLYRKELTLAEVLRKEGYNTVAITGGSWVSYKVGLDKGFDRYWEVPGPELELGKIERIYHQTIEWLEKKRTHKFFLFFHTYEIHTPYIRDTFARELPRGRIPEESANNFAFWQGDIVNIIKTATNQEKEYIKALYDGGVLEADKYLGLLFNELKEKGLWYNTIIIITSDHGEEFWEHHPIGGDHGQSLYRELLHVPLIIYNPTTITAQKHIEEYVSLLDIFPTLLDLLGIEEVKHQRLMGESLVPLMKGEANYTHPPLFAEVKKMGTNIRLQSIFTDKYKYIYSLDGGHEVDYNGFPITIKEEELFDIRHDFNEVEELTVFEPGLLQKAKDELQQYINENLKLLTPPPPNPRLKYDEELRKKLKALGYIK
ncbi:MAG: sulfatase [Acidobacteriota bacterium]